MGKALHVRIDLYHIGHDDQILGSPIQSRHSAERLQRLLLNGCNNRGAPPFARAWPRCSKSRFHIRLHRCTRAEARSTRSASWTVNASIPQPEGSGMTGQLTAEPVLARSTDTDFLPGP